MATVTDNTVNVFVEQEDRLVGLLTGLGPADTITVLQHWKVRVDADGVQPADEPARSLHHSPTLGNRWEGTWSLDGEAGAVVDTALRIASTHDGTHEERSAAQRRADALVDVCRFFLDHQHTKLGGRHRPHLNVLVDLDPAGHPRSARISDGPELDRSTLSRLACDCAFHRLVMAGGSTILDYGRATRTIPAPLWNTLVARDQHCRFPGCDRPVHWCEGHHVTPWEHGGETRPDNLVLLCTRHHHRLHMPGWNAKLLPDATLEVTQPNGTTRTTRPPGALAVAGDNDDRRSS